MNYIQLQCLDVDILHVFDVEIHRTININGKYKLKYDEQNMLARIFLVFSVAERSAERRTRLVILQKV